MPQLEQSAMAETHTVTVELPDSIGVTLRGFARKLDTRSLPANVIVALFEKGVQRGSNDPLGALFEKGETVAESKVDEYWNDLVARWNRGEVAKTRTGGLGRTTDPVQREIKRLATAHVEQPARLAKILAHHGVGGTPMSRKAFDESLKAKYVQAHIERNKDALEREAKANLAKLAKSAEADVELLDIDADEPKTDE
jgi:hypothetical protein